MGVGGLIFFFFFQDTKGAKLKSDDPVLNLSLLSLLLDFGLYDKYADCLNLPFLHSLKRKNTRELQVNIMIVENL